MRKVLWACLAALPLVVGGLVFAGTQVNKAQGSPEAEEGFVCPITGEDLPCEKCCPLNGRK
jgi:hypothetical protein